ncbi:rod shape-determining protein RodA [Roseivirga spongicola]|uniref:Cell wall polymerase n=1 Tax=Roseivirga spongicola TaxID=333140 RepID=A0A150XHH9_9BACT|nr:rod shape-determining protein RodA [Roseivirga spongicola]KYG78161.1 rod shape-determining protein RodA [Roseivirga spongicola]WPZ11902.1 rod shape-determining protein RodA [Roseivirga spongicola]
MRREGGFFTDLDWLVVFIYFILVALGWFNIFASVYDPVANQSILDMTLNSGRQLIFIGVALVPILVILLLDFRIYESFAPLFYGLMILLLAGVLIFGKEVNGAKAWFEVGAFRFQPAEFTKMATALILARFVSGTGVKLTDLSSQLKALLIIGLPIGLIMLQPDFGSVIIFSSLIIPMYREGFPSIYLILALIVSVLFVLTLLVPQNYILIGIGAVTVIAATMQLKKPKRIIPIALIAIGVTGFVLATDFLLNEVVAEYQRKRVEAIFRPELVDPMNEGWNLEQSKIAIGSGGFTGKGFLEGTQTKFGYVPEQSTDFIFSTLAEEHGWLGSAVVIILFITLVMRLVFIAERQKSKFARFYGYSVAAIIFFHFTINIAMTIGLFPVVGIPLPFFSYGGSSLWSFTIMLFVLLKIDMHRAQVLSRH